MPKAVCRALLLKMRIHIYIVKSTLHSQENTLFICIYQKKVVPLQYEK